MKTTHLFDPIINHLKLPALRAAAVDCHCLPKPSQALGVLKPILKTTTWMLALTSLTCWNAMAQNLVSNPDFESGATGGYAAGSQDLPSWTVDTTPADGMQLSSASTFSATQNPNTNVLQLTGGSAYDVGGGVQQTIATTAGVTYTISIDVANRQNGSVTGNFSFGGQNQSISASSRTFTTLTWTVVASDVTTLIDITGSTSSGSVQLLIDNVSVTPLAVASDATSTVTAAPATVPADGTNTSTITVTLLDSGSNPVPGKTVTLAHTTGPGTPTITTISGITGGTGVATFTVASTTLGAAVFTATDVTDAFAITQTATVNFVAVNPITWGTPATISGDTDVSTVGTFKYAYHWDGGNNTVNGVPFTGTTSMTTGGSDVRLYGFGGYYNAFTSSVAPFVSLSPEYKAMLVGSAYDGNVGVTLNNLTAGKQYAVQVWCQDPRNIGGRSAILSSIAGNSVTLDYNSTDSDGGVGQYSIGTFTALSTVQTFTIEAPGSSTQLNALQVRELIAVDDYAAWSGPSGFNLANGPAGDDDNDGLTNQEEYAFGLTPNSGASVNPITIQLNKSARTFTYTRRDTTKADLNYSVWFSTNLSTWTRDTGATEGTPVLTGEVETVEVILSALPGDPLPDKLFVQVRAN